MPPPSNKYQTRSVREKDQEPDTLSVHQEQILEAQLELPITGDFEDHPEVNGFEEDYSEMAQRVSLAIFNGDQAERGDVWLTYFNKYASLHNYTDAKQLDLLPFFLGRHAKVWYDSLTEEKKTDLTILKGEFLQRFSETASDMDFYSLCQNLGETAADYFTRCQQAMVGKNCPENIQIMTVIRGLLPAIQQHVILKAPKTMEQTREAMLLTEMASQRYGPQSTPVSQLTTSTNDHLLQAVKELTASVSALNMQGNRPTNNAPKSRPPQRNQPRDNRTRQNRYCSRCNGKHFFGFQFCPARDIQCTKCQEIGHFSDLCQNPPSNNSQ